MERVELLTRKSAIEEVEIVLLAYGNERLKTWFIFDGKQIAPKGSHLLMHLTGVVTLEPWRTSGTYPAVGDVVCASDGRRFVVKSAELV